jgi:DNA modification methylase
MPPTPIVTLILGDSLQVLRDPSLGALRPTAGKIGKADAIVCDPPYGFDFAGDKDWDTFEDGRSHATAADDSEKFAEFSRDWIRAAMERLWPGAHVGAFAASKTMDLLGRGIRLSGLQMVRPMAWMYSTSQVTNVNDPRAAFEPFLIGRYLGEMGNLADLGKLFKEKGRGQLNGQQWKVEDNGKHPTDIIINDELGAEDEDLARLIRDAKPCFYCAKPNPKDRDWGATDLPLRKKETSFGFKGANNVEAYNIHPTVKPISLMRRLTTLMTRPGHLVLDPFMGSGTEGIAAVLEGRHYVGIEREPDYFEIAVARVNAALKEVGGAPATVVKHGEATV